MRDGHDGARHAVAGGVHLAQAVQVAARHSSAPDGPATE